MSQDFQHHVLPTDVTRPTQRSSRSRPVRIDDVFAAHRVYLASPASDFMTGQTIFLDGGHSAA